MSERFSVALSHAPLFTNRSRYRVPNSGTAKAISTRMMVTARNLL